MTLKNDKYRKARGGKAFLIRLYCAKCDCELLLYQKDGDGQLKRCYLNRIFAPPELQGLNKKGIKLNNVPKLACLSCGTVIGSPIIHHDGRIAFRLRQGYFLKKRITE